MMVNIRYLKALMVLACVVIIRQASAYDFIPTGPEWQSWPGYCQAKYVWTPVGENSVFRGRVGSRQKEELAYWENGGISAVHHYCAGTLWLRRAKMEAAPTKKSWMFAQAWAETGFTATRSDRNAPLFTQIVLLQATILFEQDEVQRAIVLLQQRIIEHPSGDMLYSATAIMQRKLGELDEARSTLLQGDKATNGDSAEINYNLGLVSLELGKVDDARKYAERAYSLGYPLPGLRRKLARLGS